MPGDTSENNIDLKAENSIKSGKYDHLENMGIQELFQTQLSMFNVNKELLIKFSPKLLTYVRSRWVDLQSLLAAGGGGDQSESTLLQVVSHPLLLWS